MKITWLGQAGLLFESENATIMIDPYLSDSVAKVQPANYRRVPVNSKLFDIRPDIMIITHNHLDHYDPETFPVFAKKYTGMTVLASFNAWNEARACGNGNNYVNFNSGTTWTEKGFTFTAVKAEHSDAAAIGVIIDDGEKKYYVTGDTLYNKNVIKDLPENIDVVFLPINGVGNNMNFYDAEKFQREIGAKTSVPVHFGMFDELDPEEYKAKNRVIPKIYEEIKI